MLPLLLGWIGPEPSPAVRGIVVQSIESREIVVRLEVEGQVRAFSQPRMLPSGEVEAILFNTALAAGFSPPETPAFIEHIQVREERGNVYVRLLMKGGADVEATAFRDANTQDVLLRFVPVPEEIESSPAQAIGSVPARWKLDTIVLDPGHGGRDPGAVGNGLQEKDITLAVARKLGHMIESELGIRVVYTRTTDTFVELSRRGHLANEAGGKLFLSLHANAATSSAASGTETFFLGMHKTDAARSVMERENSAVRYESDQGRYEDMNEQTLILQALAYSAYMQKSEELAGTIEQAFGARADRNSRGVKQAGFYVLWSASMPAVLVELGFITNPHEAAYMASEGGQATLARAIFASVRTFQGQYERELQLAGGE